MSLFLEYFSSLKIALGPDYRQFPRVLPAKQWSIAGATISNVQLLVIATVLILVLGLQFIVYRTKIGKAMRAVALDMDAARLMGIDVDRVIAYTFALGSGLAAAAAMAYRQIWPFVGVMAGLKAFTAAVLGGIGSLPGALLGALIMGQAEVMTVAYGNTDYKDAIAFAILILVLLIRPAGLLGKAGPEKV